MKVKKALNGTVFIEKVSVAVAPGIASALLGAYMNGLSLAESARIAVDYTHGCIVRTKEAGTDLRYGVDFEHGIPDLLRQTGII